MTNLGILLACEHYPEVSTSPARLDAQLRLWLEETGHVVTQIKVFNSFFGMLPEDPRDCDLWIVSGALIDYAQSSDCALHVFLRAAEASGREIYGLNHGEHVMHKALAQTGSLPPATPALPRSIRNPFNSFWRSDTLFAFDPKARSVQALPRPRALADLGFGAAA